MWYVKAKGSKLSYLKPLREIFREHKGKELIEPFAGTYTVSAAAIDEGIKKAWCSDIGYWSFCIGCALSRKTRMRQAAVACYWLEEEKREADKRWEGFKRSYKEVSDTKLKPYLTRLRGVKYPQIKPHWLPYHVFLKRSTKGKVVYIDPPKVFKSSPKTLYYKYAELDKTLGAKRVYTLDWSPETVVDHFKRILTRIKGADVIIWEAYKKAVPPPEGVRSLLKKYLPTYKITEIPYRNDIIYVAEAR